MKQRIFISSVQKEFAEERQALKTYIQGDALLSRFFDVFLFEDIPARDRRAEPPPGTWKHWSRKEFCAWKEKGGAPSMCSPESQGQMRQKCAKCASQSKPRRSLADWGIAPLLHHPASPQSRPQNGTGRGQTGHPQLNRNEPEMSQMGHTAAKQEVGGNEQDRQIRQEGRNERPGRGSSRTRTG